MSEKDYELYIAFKALEKKWKDRSAEIIDEMIASGVDKIWTEDQTHSIKLVKMPEAQIPNYVRKSYQYILVR